MCENILFNIFIFVNSLFNITYQKYLAEVRFPTEWRFISNHQNVLIDMDNKFLGAVNMKGGTYY